MLAPSLTSRLKAPTFALWAPRVTISSAQRTAGHALALLTVQRRLSSTTFGVA
jgi:hypothetical protein